MVFGNGVIVSIVKNKNGDITSLGNKCIANLGQSLARVKI